MTELGVLKSLLHLRITPDVSHVRWRNVKESKGQLCRFRNCLNRISAVAKNEIDELTRVFENTILARVSKESTWLNGAIIGCCMISLISVLLTGLGLIRYTKMILEKILYPIGELVQVFEGLAEGKLTQHLPVTAA